MLLAGTTDNSHVWFIAGALGIALLVLVVVALFFIRRFFENTRDAHRANLTVAPSTENPSSFMAASMQGVIQKLREQEKELEHLHRIEKERAEQTERLSEEVTRNMPAGLLIVNATGIISSANPAAEQALGIQGLAFRRYSEVLGENSELTKLLSECLVEGKIFRREQVEHPAPGGECRHLGVTISPIRRGVGKINGAICLMMDLTELAMLQQRVQLKENLAALGELSAGIAHEFKNALATISGYAQMIRADASGDEAADYSQKILDQTRNITHVITEFLKYARPLEISNEQVALQSLVERIVSEISEAMPDVRIRCEGAFNNVPGDEGLLRQALLNLARNAARSLRRRRQWRSRPPSRRSSPRPRNRLPAHHHLRQRSRHPLLRARQTLPPLLHHQGQRHRTRSRGGPENRRPARRPGRRPQSSRRRRRVYRYATRVRGSPRSGRIE